jgi:hypothetical protein
MEGSGSIPVSDQMGLEALEILLAKVAAPDPALVGDNRQAIARHHELLEPRHDSRQELVVLQAVNVSGVAHERAVPIEEDEAAQGLHSLARASSATQPEAGDERWSIRQDPRTRFCVGSL